MLPMRFMGMERGNTDSARDEIIGVVEWYNEDTENAKRKIGLWSNF